MVVLKLWEVIIMEIMKIKKAYIVMKETNEDSLNNINKYIGTYPNIKIAKVADAYPNGKD